jgi:hypothetical protein
MPHQVSLPSRALESPDPHVINRRIISPYLHGDPDLPSTPHDHECGEVIHPLQLVVGKVQSILRVHAGVHLLLVSLELGMSGDQVRIAMGRGRGGGTGQGYGQVDEGKE